jgi:hypothetical protein
MWPVCKHTLKGGSVGHQKSQECGFEQEQTEVTEKNLTRFKTLLSPLPPVQLLVFAFVMSCSIVAETPQVIS